MMLIFLPAAPDSKPLQEGCHHCMLNDEHNYTLSAELEIPSVPLAAYSM